VSSAGDPEAGEELFNQVCIACHGPGGEGIDGLGKPFTTSDFIPPRAMRRLLEFIKTGRPVGHPDNTTGVDMPPEGRQPGSHRRADHGHHRLHPFDSRVNPHFCSHKQA
jgi:mono/diheme cytochrome c family protein